MSDLAAHHSDDLEQDEDSSQASPRLVTAFISLFYIAIVLFVFWRVNTRLEVVVTSLVGLTYAAIWSAYLWTHYSLRRMAAGFDLKMERLWIATTSGHGFNADDRADLLKKEIRVNRNLERGDRTMWLEQAELFVVGAVCLYQLFRTLS